MVLQIKDLHYVDDFIIPPQCGDFRVIINTAEIIWFGNPLVPLARAQLTQNNERETIPSHAYKTSHPRPS